jgi:hypothetical protein
MDADPEEHEINLNPRWRLMGMLENESITYLRPAQFYEQVH